MNEFQDQRPLNTRRTSFQAFAMTDPVGGARTYFFFDKIKMRGQAAKIIVGKRYESQKPMNLSAYTVAMDPAREPTLISR